ncbi:hypothetical protein E2C01_078446 [Portunus trituberculatus]|uniref:Uncharacterized protein n=1 Tax=Portunus trituberculatus TaxID=210409 RepID=A0A5B7IGZ6_PORTR|nr:hypothetical protein [Portunus trituberculatus]
MKEVLGACGEVLRKGCSEEDEIKKAGLWYTSEAALFNDRFHGKKDEMIPPEGAPLIQAMERRDVSWARLVLGCFQVCVCV